jgi:hypothetical protein
MDRACFDHDEGVFAPAAWRGTGHPSARRGDWPNVRALASLKDGRFHS